MAKKSAKKAAREAREGRDAKVVVHDANIPESEAVRAFARGDYARARVLLAHEAEDQSRPEGERARARELLDATKPERTALLAGLACIALYGLVALATALIQP